MTAFVKLMGLYMVNHGAGFGLEIPCMNRCYGSLALIERLKSLLLQQRTSLTAENSCTLFYFTPYSGRLQGDCVTTD